jgi:hypothetical protein
MVVSVKEINGIFGPFLGGLEVWSAKSEILRD